MVKIQMMCGKRNFGADWVHVDKAPFDHVASSDIEMIWRCNDTVDIIYCSHGIAYFGTDEIKHLLGCWLRVLKPGGILRIATPDFKKLAQLYVNKGVMIDKLLGPLYGHMQADGHIQHQTCYDYESLTELLRQCGFTDWENYDHRYTEHPNTGNRTDKYDDHSAAYIDGVLISLNVECKKPDDNSSN